MSDKPKNPTRQEKANLKKLATARLRKIDKDSTWSTTQSILQEIIATFKITEQKVPAIRKLVELLEQEVSIRYKDDGELKDVILEAIPSDVTVGAWMKKEGWEDAVWEKCRIDGLFTSEKRAKVIDSLYKKATSEKPDTTAAKLWLTMSGDYSEKIDVGRNDILDQFREINNILHSKKDA